MTTFIVAFRFSCSFFQEKSSYVTGKIHLFWPGVDFKCGCDICAVVQCYHWLTFYSSLFLGEVMYDNL